MSAKTWNQVLVIRYFLVRNLRPMLSFAYCFRFFIGLQYLFLSDDNWGLIVLVYIVTLFLNALLRAHLSHTHTHTAFHPHTHMYTQHKHPLTCANTFIKFYSGQIHTKPFSLQPILIAQKMSYCL